jgi:hypothetical protein
LWAFKLRKPFDASSIAAAVQRIAIEDECQRFTFRQTRRTVPMTFSIHVGTSFNHLPKSVTQQWLEQDRVLL